MTGWVEEDKTATKPDKEWPEWDKEKQRKIRTRRGEGNPTGMAGWLTASVATKEPNRALAGPGGLWWCPFQE